MHSKSDGSLYPATAAKSSIKAGLNHDSWDRPGDWQKRWGVSGPMPCV